jgi:uncharacterized integral membrane protein
VAGETPEPPESPEPVAAPPEPPAAPPEPPAAPAIAPEVQEIVAEERHSPVRFWLKVAALLFAVGYSVAFVVGNSKSIKVDFVFGTAHVTLIWTVLLLLVIGFVAGVLGSHLYRQRRSQKPRKP